MARVSNHFSVHYTNTTNMKRTVLTLFASFLVIASFAQYKGSDYNRLTDLKGTDHVIASMQPWAKAGIESAHFLLFINTATGEHRRIEFPRGAYIDHIEQLKLDTLQINRVIVTGYTINPDNDKSIDWNDPRQITIFSPDGKEQVKITGDNYYARYWTLNRQTGVLVISGRVDSNGNGKLDKNDKAEILLYDLKQMKQLTKL